MDGARFDRLTRSLAGRYSRRGVLGGLAGVAAGLIRLRAAEGACPPGSVATGGGRCICKGTGRPPGPDGCPAGPGQSSCNGAQVDFSSDPRNCGGCGVVCPVATAGTCQGAPICRAGICGFAPVPSGTVCRNATGPCDLPATCDGASIACPPNPFKASTVPCRSAVDACDTTDHCSGSSAQCPADAKATTGTPCGTGPTCSGGSAKAQDTCNGSGSCVPGATTACGLYLCGATACRTTCGDDSHCVDSAHCDGGVCIGDLPNGQPCDEPSDCASGICNPVSHTCCSTSCEAGAPCGPTGVCGCPPGQHQCGNACFLDTDPNRCGAACAKCVPPVNADATCDGTRCGFICHAGYTKLGSVCCPDANVCGDTCLAAPCPAPCQVCSAAQGACVPAPAGTTCGAGPSCAAGIAKAQDTCSGGVCTLGATTPCGLYQCDGVVCLITCSDDAHCVASAHCEAGACVGDLPDGQPCDEPSDCASGICNLAIPTAGTCCPIAYPPDVPCLGAGNTCGCPSGQHACAGGCFSDTDSTHCGADCLNCPSPQHGSATCSGGTCGIACDAGFHRCGDSCVQDDSATQCGTSCTDCTTNAPANSTPTCSGGTCAYPCDTAHGASTCGSVCCAEGESCVDDRCQMVCPPEQQCGVDGPCCPAGERCTVYDGCCPITQWCLLNWCCGHFQQCTIFGCQDTCPPERQCGTVCCPAGEICIDGTCQDPCPVERRCSGVCCPEGQTCVDGVCCPIARHCGDICCDIRHTCTNDGCCLANRVCGAECCGNGEQCIDGVCQAVVCQAEQECGPDCCWNDERCTPDGCCPNAQWCPIIDIWCCPPGQRCNFFNGCS